MLCKFNKCVKSVRILKITDKTIEIVFISPDAVYWLICLLLLTCHCFATMICVWNYVWNGESMSLDQDFFVQSRLFSRHSMQLNPRLIQGKWVNSRWNSIQTIPFLSSQGQEFFPPLLWLHSRHFSRHFQVSTLSQIILQCLDQVSILYFNTTRINILSTQACQKKIILYVIYYIHLFWFVFPKF